MNLGGRGAVSSDYETPEGTVDNTQSRGAFANIGVSRTSQDAYLGAGVQIDDTKYGVPVIEEGAISLTPRRQVYGTRGEMRNLSGLFSSARGSLAYHRYRHEELVGDVVGTEFRNDLVDVDVRATHRAVGRVTGTVGVSGYGRTFESVGEEALSPKVDQNVYSAFSYQEVAWSHATLQFGGRFDHAGYSPEGGLRPREFNNVSFSLGSLFRPSEKSTLAVSFARAARNPALEELYFSACTPATSRSRLATRTSTPRSPTASTCPTAPACRGCRPRSPTSTTRSTTTSSAARSTRRSSMTGSAMRDAAKRTMRTKTLPIIEFIGRDARLQGVEAHADLDVTAGLHLELGVDTVHGSLRDSGEPLPRIPPVRFIGGLQYHRDALQVGAQVVSALEQDRVYDTETTTRRVYDAAAVRRLLAAGGTVAAHVLGTIGQRDRPAVPQPPVAREGPRPGDGPQLPRRVEREVLDRTTGPTGAQESGRQEHSCES